MQVIKSAALITKAIASIKGRGAKLDTDIHVAGVSVLMHASEHGDTTLADKLVQAMPKGGRTLALVEWMLAFGQLAKLDPKVKEDAAAIKTGRLFKLDRSRTLNQAGAIAKSWVEFKPEAEIATAYDLQGAVKALLARIKKAKEDGLEVTELTAEQKAALAALAA